MLVMLSGCAASIHKVVERDLPDPPDYLSTVPVPPVREGQDARAVAAENRAALVTANRRLSDGRHWYLCLQRGYRGAAPAECGGRRQ